MSIKAKVINFYPTIDSYLVDSLKTKVNYNFYFKENDDIITIQHNVDGKNISFDTKNINWNSDDYDLVVNISLSIENTKCLFGPDGVAPINSKIGVGIEWFSAQSKIRDFVISNELIDNNLSNYVANFEFVLPKRTFNGSINVNVSLYLSESAAVLSENEDYLNNTSGIILGNIDEKVIFLSGFGSLFPIRIEPIDDSRLWKLQINYSDPEINSLSDGMVLILNSKHKDYHFLDPKSSDYCDKFAEEIVSNAITMLLCKLKEDQYLEDISDGYMNGSIMEFVRYCKDTLEIDFTDVNSICDSVRKFADGSD